MNALHKKRKKKTKIIHSLCWISLTYIKNQFTNTDREISKNYHHNRPIRIFSHRVQKLILNIYHSNVKKSLDLKLPKNTNISSWFNEVRYVVQEITPKEFSFALNFELTCKFAKNII